MWTGEPPERPVKARFLKMPIYDTRRTLLLMVLLAAGFGLGAYAWANVKVCIVPSMYTPWPVSFILFNRYWFSDWGEVLTLPTVIAVALWCVTPFTRFRFVPLWAIWECLIAIILFLVYARFLSPILRYCSAMAGLH